MPVDTRPDGATGVSRPLAIGLLGWIGAIKATGASLATVALVDAARALALSDAERAIAASAGTLSLAATVMASGLVADRLGRRRVLMASYLLATAGSLLVLVSPGAALYIVGQSLAGIGFGAMFAGSYAFVKAIAPGAGLGWALGLFGTYCSLVAAFASVGGGLLAFVSWRLLFAVVPVMCLVAWLGTPRLLPVMPPIPGGRVDVRGLVLLGAGMVLLLIGVSQATQTLGPFAWVPAVAGVATLVAWGLVESRSPNPAFPIGLLRSGPFVAAALVGVTFNLVQAASSLQLSNYWQYLDQQTALLVTLQIQPFYVIGVIGALVAGHLLSRGRGARGVIVVSCLLTAAGFLALIPLGQGASYWAFLPAVILIGIGMQAGTTAQSQVFVQQAPHTAYGTVTASRSSIGQVGFAFGFALSAVLMDRLTQGGVTERMRDAGVDDYALRHSLAAIDAYVQAGRESTSRLGQEALTVAADSFQAAFQVLMGTCALVMAVSAVAVWLLMRRAASAP